MKHKLFLLFLLAVGVINIIPVLGLFSASQLAAAYGIDLNSAELALLMRHRALLFGLIGGLVLISLFKPQLQVTAMLLSGISMLGFMALAWPIDGLNDQVKRVFMVDVVGVLCLILAVVFYWHHTKNNDQGRL